MQQMARFKLKDCLSVSFRGWKLYDDERFIAKGGGKYFTCRHRNMKVYSSIE